MEKKPLISVIVPIYKVEKYLSRCIESIQKQSYSKLEIILVDDGSPDKCPKICDNYALLDKRIKVIHKPNGGISSARNAGLDVMTGDFVTYVDSDDFIHKDFIKWLCLFCTTKQCDIAACTLHSGIESNFKHVSIKGNAVIYNMKDAFLSRKIKSGIVGKLYKSSLFLNERFPVSFHFNYEDEALTYKLVYKASKIAILNKALYYYFQSPSSATRNTKHYKTTDFIEVFEHRMQFFADKDKDLLELSWEYYCLCLMLFYMSCKKDKKNTNDKEEILKLYNRAFLKVLYQQVTPIFYKMMFTAFYLEPDKCAKVVNMLHLRK